MELKEVQTEQLPENLQKTKEMKNLNYATNSMPEPAKNLKQNASTNIFARIAENAVTDRRTARTDQNEICGLQPKYLCHNLWEESSTLSPTTAEWSEHAKPLPRPPLSKTLDPISAKTIADHPQLFKIQTPIKIDVFENLLKDHPNPLFVKSVCDGLREGFWLWANNLSEGFPQTHDESRPMPSDDKRIRFIQEQCQKEQDKGYFSQSFGTDVLDGMYSMPIYAVPKPHSTDLCLVTDHSSGPYSLNN